MLRVKLKNIFGLSEAYFFPVIWKFTSTLTVGDNRQNIDNVDFVGIFNNPKGGVEWFVHEFLCGFGHKARIVSDGSLVLEVFVGRGRLIFTRALGAVFVFSSLLIYIIGPTPFNLIFLLASLVFSGILVFILPNLMGYLFFLWCLRRMKQFRKS